MYCTKCKENRDNDVNYCSSCGMKLTILQNSQSSTDSSKSKKNNSKDSIWTLAVIAFVALAVVFSALLNNNSNKNSNTNIVIPREIPILEQVNEYVGRYLTIKGTGYSDADIVLFVNDKEVQTFKANKNGSFIKDIFFDSEGKKDLKVHQKYNSITSEFSNTISTIVDYSPPTVNNFKLNTIFPEVSKNNDIFIEGTSEPGTFVIVNNTKIKVNNEGYFGVHYNLIEDTNNLNFQLSDLAGNTSDYNQKKVINVDTKPPSIFTDYCSAITLNNTTEGACVDSGQWEALLPTNVSVQMDGYIKGNIKKVTVDGKDLLWDQNGEIYNRISLYIQFGTNKYNVIVEDLVGNTSSKFLEIVAERIKDTQDVNVNIE